MLRQTGGRVVGAIDDVFIHFDYARATARGFPFQWSPATAIRAATRALLYPSCSPRLCGRLPRASLMIWAGIVASRRSSPFCWPVSASSHAKPRGNTFARRQFSRLVRSIGRSSAHGSRAFPGVWSGAFVTALDQADHAARRRHADTLVARDCLSAHGVRRSTWTRPEGATSIAALGLMVAEIVRRNRGPRAALIYLAKRVRPLSRHRRSSVASNRWRTGEFAASGLDRQAEPSTTA